jgi:hypothetical protein
MKIRFMIVLLISSISFAMPLRRAQRRILNGYDFLNFTDAERAIYSEGFWNGLKVVPDSKIVPLLMPESCFTSLTSVQISAIIKKSIENKPGQQDAPLSDFSWNAIVETCKK